jgi:hypothetical protein
MGGNLMDDDQYLMIPAGRRVSDAPAAQIEALSAKIDRLQSTVDRLLARLDLLILPRIASMNAKADMILAGERDDAHDDPPGA